MKRRVLIIVAIIILLLPFCLQFYKSYKIGKENRKHYELGKECIEEGKYELAQQELLLSNDYKDSGKLLDEVENRIEAERIKKEEVEEGEKILTTYREGNLALENEEFDIAREKYQWIINNYGGLQQFPDHLERIGIGEIVSVSQIKVIDAKYGIAIQQYESGDFKLALRSFSDKDLQDYKDSKAYIAEINIRNNEREKGTLYDKAIELLNSGEFREAQSKFELIADYEDTDKILNRMSLNNRLFAGINCCGVIDANNGGRVIVAGTNQFGQLDVSDWKGMTSIDGYHTLVVGITDKKTVKVAGKYELEKNWTGGKKVDSSEWANVIDVASGEQFVVALTYDGNVYFGGLNTYRIKETVEEWDDIVAIEAGFDFVVGLTKDKTLRFAGNANLMEKAYNQRKNEWTNVINIAAGGGNRESKHITYGHVIGLRQDGTVVAVGDNNYQQCDLKDWKDIVKVSAGDWYTVGLTADGRILTTKDDEQKEDLGEADGVVDVAAGHGETIYIDIFGYCGGAGYTENGWKELVEKVNQSIVIDSVEE